MGATPTLPAHIYTVLQDIAMLLTLTDTRSTSGVRTCVCVCKLTLDDSLRFLVCAGGSVS